VISRDRQGLGVRRRKDFRTDGDEQICLSSAEAERAFSSAGFIFDSLRTRMRPEVVRVLTVGRSVLHDVHEVDGKKAVYTFIPNTTSSTTEGETFKVTGELHHLFLSDKKN
jgi:hypothetical protein